LNNPLRNKKLLYLCVPICWKSVLGIELRGWVRYCVRKEKIIFQNHLEVKKHYLILHPLSGKEAERNETRTARGAGNEGENN